MMEPPGRHRPGRGRLPWGLHQPTANEKAEYVGYNPTETIKGIFARFCADYLLTIRRTGTAWRGKAAEYAVGTITVTGEEGTEIPAGFRVSTAATYSRASVSSRWTGGDPGEGRSPLASRRRSRGRRATWAPTPSLIVDAPIKGHHEHDNNAPCAGGIDRGEQRRRCGQGSWNMNRPRAPAL